MLRWAIADEGGRRGTLRLEWDRRVGAVAFTVK
jgi:hypothetical protein